MIDSIIEAITPSPSKIQEMEVSYNAICSYIEDNTEYKTHCYTQGSIAIGTLIKPLSNSDDYDVDIVIKFSDNFKCPKALKNHVGDILKCNKIYSNMLEPEGKRCWTIKYCETTNYHIDILPAQIIDASNKINITNIKKGNYNFQTSNPREYAKWFLNKAQGNVVMKEYDELPKINANTRLQKLVMFAKYHRNFYCEKKKISDKPISIIITTAMAMSYDKNLSDIQNLKKFANFCNIELEKKNNGYYFANPVDLDENFCDKWNENESKILIFHSWLGDFSIFISSDININSIKSTFGDKISAEILKSTFDKKSTTSKDHTFYATFQ